MHLYCTRHNTTHEMTEGDVEQVVYALTAAQADAVCEPDGDRIDAGDLPDQHMACPQEVLRSWTDPEVYAEWIEGCIESRKAVQRDGTGEPRPAWAIARAEIDA